MGNKQKAIFLDRDGTIIVDKNYLRHPSQLEYFSDTFEALRILQKKGFLLFIVTNQSGIGRGLFSLDEMQLVHLEIQNEMLNHALSPFKEIAYCPHTPSDHCNCRKPHPKLIIELIKKWSIEPKQSFMIGDKLIDAECGVAAGIQGVLLRHIHPPFLTYPNLLSFAKSI